MGSNAICLDPTTNCSLKLQLYKNVHDLDLLHKKIISGQLHCCIMKANLILDPMQVIVAANKAAVSQEQGSLITRTIHTEILYNLSITKNVTKSLSHFGMDISHDMLLVAVVFKQQDTVDDIFNEIKGEVMPLEELRKISDIKAIKKTYSITDNNDSTLLNNIINKIVTKGFS